VKEIGGLTGRERARAREGKARTKERDGRRVGQEGEGRSARCMQQAREKEERGREKDGVRNQRGNPRRGRGMEESQPTEWLISPARRGVPNAR